MRFFRDLTSSLIHAVTLLLKACMRAIAHIIAIGIMHESYSSESC